MMRKLNLIVVLAGVALVTLTQACKNSEIRHAGFLREGSDIEWLRTAVDRSGDQLLAAAAAYKDSMKNPRTFENGMVELVGERDWTSGFFPGSLWMMYELTQNDEFKTQARHYTSLLAPVQYYTGTHDLGFILYCSYGNGLRLTSDPSYIPIMLNGAKSLMTRYNPTIGLIKSWDFNRETWQFPVIIDNLMNLEFLLWASNVSGDVSMKAACLSHADKTIENHYRANNSCWHVVDYDTLTTQPRIKQTHQGYADSSSWVRGQAWGLYGYTMMYRETRQEKYLAQAQKIAAFLLDHPNMPTDKVPYWDFDVPNIQAEPRDASAAAIIASALIELSGFVSQPNTYLATAETMLKSLSSDHYLAAKGENGLFILEHSTGNWPRKSEIDTPLSYADYYYIEALIRYIKVQGLKK
jgi:unsaturated chondroitin disaccharide hydrolase